MSTIPGLPLIVFVMLGIGLIVGVVRPRRIGGYVAWLLVAPVALGAGFNLGKEIYSELLVYQKVAFVLVVSLGSIVVLGRLLLPKDVREVVVGSFVYDLLKYAVHLPFRVLSWLVRRLKADP